MNQLQMVKFCDLDSGPNLSAVLTLSLVCHLRPTFIVEFNYLG